MFLKRLDKIPALPENDAEDLKKQKLILEIMLVFSIMGAVIVNTIRLYDLWRYPHTRGIPLPYTLLMLAFFIFLFWLSRYEKTKIASWLFLVSFSVPMFYSFIIWGADLPAALLLTVLFITLSGILIGSRLVIINTFLINLFLVVLTYLQSYGIVKVQSYWRLEKHSLGDAISYAALFLIIAAIAYIFCIDIQKALKRARYSEAELRKERDMLEIKVAERTTQLRQIEAEKIDQLYRLADFGRLSSGIFHDLINPLTAISLNLEQIKDNDDGNITPAKTFLTQALLATHRMEGLISGIKKQIQKESSITIFSANKEIEEIIQILAYKARSANVRIIITADTDIKLNGDPIKFGQIISNLVSNAIDATEEANSGAKKQENIIKINLTINEGQVAISVCDHGTGIAQENMDKIFKISFSTKNKTGRGLGIGLTSTKTIVEKNFGGTISVKSHLGEGSCFFVTIPLNNPYYEKPSDLSVASLVSGEPVAIGTKTTNT